MRDVDTRDPRSARDVDIRDPRARPADPRRGGEPAEGISGMDVDLRQPPGGPAWPTPDTDLRVRDTDLRVPDRDMRSAGWAELPGPMDFDKDASDLPLPFKPVDFKPCVEIDASVNSHPPMDLRADPRLKAHRRRSSQEDKAPAKPPVIPTEPNREYEQQLAMEREDPRYREPRPDPRQDPRAAAAAADPRRAAAAAAGAMPPLMMPPQQQQQMAAAMQMQNRMMYPAMPKPGLLGVMPGVPGPGMMPGLYPPAARPLMQHMPNYGRGGMMYGDGGMGRGMHSPLGRSTTCATYRLS
ncbi:hypothetical protein FJT64_000102 [Amphibalanus amphitrite]|uniref:Uncharacterized protein n=1 Tax=Amphibalanus amphitrite TaxID=1232801 RepID=A0A6A4WIY9_AMPAM|nr:hypothetical protein FJT64_000102 [Amphibalanus amphitrite]